MEKALQALVSLLYSTIRDIREHVDAEEKLAIETKSHVCTAVHAEIAHLREQNVLLTHLLDSERTKGERARDELIVRISGMLTEFTSTRDRELKEGVEGFKNANVRCEKRLGEFEVSHGTRMDTFAVKAKDVSKVMERRSTEGKRAKDTASKVRHLLSSLRS
jgi:kinesin family protein 11